MLTTVASAQERLLVIVSTENIPLSLHREVSELGPHRNPTSPGSDDDPHKIPTDETAHRDTVRHAR